VEKDCDICMEVLPRDLVLFKSCKHYFCSRCVKRLFDLSGRNVLNCPMCRANVTSDDCITFAQATSSLEQARRLEATAAAAAAQTQNQAMKTQGEVVTSSSSSVAAPHSSKTVEILTELQRIRSRGGEKVVIFSGFVGYLMLLKQALEGDGFGTETFTGSMSAPQRSRAISRFSTDPAVTVILCSVKAAGVGITLTAANHVFLADLWWAPAGMFCL